jgi:hypothetical protein
MSGTTVSGIRVPIIAVDNTAVTINRVKRSLADLTASASRTSSRVSRVTDPFAFNRLSQSMLTLGGSTLGTARSMERLVPALGAITSATSIAGLGLLVQRFADLGQQVANIGQRLGTPVDRLTALQGAAKLAGVTTADMTAGLTALDERLRSATFRGDALSIQTFNRLGVSFGQLGHHARTAEEAFGDVAAGIKRVNDTQGRGAALRAAQILGLEGLFPLLLKGREGVADLVAEAKRLNMIITPEMAQRAVELHTSFGRLEGAVGGFANVVSDRLSPVLTHLLNQFAALIADNTKWIGDDIGNYVERFAARLKKVDWSPVKRGLDEVWASTQKIRDYDWLDKRQTIAHLKEDWCGVLAVVNYLKKTYDEIAALKVPDWLEAIFNISPTEWGSRAGKWVREHIGGDEPPSAFTYGPSEFKPLSMPSMPSWSWGSPLPWGGTPGGGAWFPGLARHLQPGSYDYGPLPWAGRSAGAGAPGSSGLPPVIERQVRLDARLAGEDEDRMVALFWAEHGGFANVSPKGNFGPAQLGWRTARDMGVAESVNDPSYDWRQNVLAGVRYFHQLRASLGSYDAAEAAYNAGPSGRGVKWLATTGDRSLLPDETQNYLKAIDGHVAVTVDINGAAPGTKANAISSGIASASQPRVMMAMPLLGF